MLRKKARDKMLSYFEDSSNLAGGYADELIMPENIEELAEFLREAEAKRLPVTISAGGTGTTGARIPFGGAVVSMERFNKIVDISEAAMSARVEAGVPVEEFKNSCEKVNLFYASHPTEPTAFIGGTIATNASGARSFRYGPTRKYINRLKMVLADGRILDIRRWERTLRKNDSTLKLPDGSRIDIPLPAYRMPDVKNSAGYYAKDGMDAIDLFIGQEGTLSVIAEAEIRLLKKPARIFGCFVFFKNEADAWNFSRALRGEKKMGVLSLEYFDSNALLLLGAANNSVPEKMRAAIYFEEELDETTKEEGLLERREKLIAQNKASLDDTWIAEDHEAISRFMKFRHHIPDAINELTRRSGLVKQSTDIAVPDDKFFDMMNYYSRVFKDTDIRHVIFGHIGENHLHVNIMPRSRAEAKLAKKICLDLVKKGVHLGGTVSAEHGIGKTRHKYLEEMYGRRGVLEMARIKKALDPNCILGPGNIFPKKILHSLAP